jgi:hypothetical protein
MASKTSKWKRQGEAVRFIDRVSDAIAKRAVSTRRQSTSKDDAIVAGEFRISKARVRHIRQQFVPWASRA